MDRLLDKTAKKKYNSHKKQQIRNYKQYRKQDAIRYEIQIQGVTDMTIEERAKKAVELKTTGGYNCSQAVTAALADQTSLTEEQLKQRTAGFCAGMGNLEATCGALIGAGMIIGLKTEGKGTLPKTKKLQETFRDRCGAIQCRELKTLIDGKPLCACEECVRNAVLIYGEVMGEA